MAHRHHRIAVMGTVVTVDGYATDEIDDAWWAEAMALITADLEWVDDTFSTWKPESPISRLRRGDCSRDDVANEIGVVLDHCSALVELTRGWFDPWAFSDGVDPTGYVKGWAAQRALAYVADGPLCGAIVNAAGDVALVGGPRPMENFTLGIVDPFDRTKLRRTAVIRHALATSGEAERGSHVLNPFTGAFTAAVASASVTGGELGIADALATALCVGGPEVLGIIDAIEGYEAFTVGLDGREHATPGFPFAASS